MTDIQFAKFITEIVDATKQLYVHNPVDVDPNGVGATMLIECSAIGKKHNVLEERFDTLQAIKLATEINEQRNNIQVADSPGG